MPYETVDIGTSTKLIGMQFDSEECKLLADFKNRRYPNDPEAGAQAEYSNVTDDIVVQLKAEAERPGGSVGSLLYKLVEAKPGEFPMRYTREAKP